jgi:hypothetical protein
MIISTGFNEPPKLPADQVARWSGTDKGLIAAWLRGIEKRVESPELAAQCAKGELPVLAWKGGCQRYIKSGKTGSLLYLATWQGLRGEDLHVDMESEPVMYCSKTGTKVIFTLDKKKLFKEEEDGSTGD